MIVTAHETEPDPDVTVLFELAGLAGTADAVHA